MSSPIKVVLVEDSAIALQILHRLLDSSSEVNVVGTAQDRAEGLNVIAQTDPSSWEWFLDDINAQQLIAIGMNSILRLRYQNIALNHFESV